MVPWLSDSVSEDVGLETNVRVVARNTKTGEVRVIETKNVTTIGGHEALAEFWAGSGGEEPTDLALGLDGASGTSTSDRSLNNEDARTAVNTRSASGATTTIRVFVPSQLQIGTSSNTVDELGLVLGNGDLANHATISSVDLSGTDTLLNVTIDITMGDK